MRPKLGYLASHAGLAGGGHPGRTPPARDPPCRMHPWLLRSTCLRGSSERQRQPRACGELLKGALRGTGDGCLALRAFRMACEHGSAWSPARAPRTAQSSLEDAPPFRAAPAPVSTMPSSLPGDPSFGAVCSL